MSPGAAPSQDLGRARARFALDKVRAVPDGMKPGYARLVRRLPAMILRNGLGQALAFHLADAKGVAATPPGRVVLDLSEWLIRERRIYAGADPGKLAGLIEALVAGDAGAYRRAQQEALAVLDWMKKFADAFLPVEAEP